MKRPLSQHSMAPILAPTGPTTNETTTTTSSSDISLSSHSHSLGRPSSPLHSPSPQSCVHPTSTIPTISDQRYQFAYLTYLNPRPTLRHLQCHRHISLRHLPHRCIQTPRCLPIHRFFLKVVCFPPPAPQRLPSLPPAAMMVDEHERRMKGWDTIDVNMADDRRQQHSQLG
ncbi:hypothetical protein BYT27DRAFT_6870255 [Phlegmacium glaucopus]|nr:hypothetical protein BYT27DRAFT_6870255 [Phlegmacium glaucopus]